MLTIKKAILMSERFVADTMALVLRLEKRRMPLSIKELFLSAESGQCHIYIPSIVLAEVGYLSERGRIDTSLNDVDDYFSSFSNVSEVPLSFFIIKNSFGIDDIPELHDRLIAGTSFSLNIPLLTNDPVITGSRHVDVIW